MDDVVFKYSVANGLTRGKVVSIGGTVMVEYAKLKRTFKGVIFVEGSDDRPFSAVRDSGSLVYNKRGIAIGIVFAIGNNLSIVCPLTSILNELNCKLYT